MNAEDKLSDEQRHERMLQMLRDSLDLYCAQVMRLSAPYLLGDLMDNQDEVDKLKAMRQKVKAFTASIANMTDKLLLESNCDKLRDVTHALNVRVLDKIPNDLYNKIDNLEV